MASIEEEQGMADSAESCSNWKLKHESATSPTVSYTLIAIVNVLGIIYTL